MAPEMPKLALEMYRNGGLYKRHPPPRIPWTRLRKLRRAAPEFYVSLHTEESVLRAVWTRAMGVSDTGLRYRV